MIASSRQSGQAHGRPYKREFGVPEASDRESFTDSDSRIRSVGGGGLTTATTRRRPLMRRHTGSWRPR